MPPRGRDIALARLFYDIEAETKSLDQGLKDSERKLVSFSTFVRAHPMKALGALTAAAAVAGVQAAKMAEQFDAAARKIAATIPDGTARLQDLKKAADQLAISKGLSSDVVLAGLSAIAKEGVTGVEALIARFEALQTAADATGTDVAALAGPFDQILDVFGLADTELQRVAATLAAISQERGIGFEDFLGAFQSAAPVIREAGLSFDEGAEAISRLLAAGLSAKQVAADLKEQLKALGEEGLKSLATDARNATKDMGDLSERARLVRESMERTRGDIDAAFAARTRAIGQAINDNILNPLLQAGHLLTLLATGGAKASTSVSTAADRLLAAIRIMSPTAGAILTGFQALGDEEPGPSPVDRGGPVQLPEITTTAPGKKELEELRDGLTKTFTANLPATVEATASAIRALRERLRELGTPASEITERLEPLLEQLARLRAAAADLSLTQAIGDAEGAASAAASLDQLGALAADLMLQIQGANKGSAEQVALQERLLRVNEAIARVNRRIVDLKDDESQGAHDVADFTGDATADAQAMRQALSLTVEQLGDAARGAIGLAQAFGLAGDSAAALLQNVVTLATTLPKTIKAFEGLGKVDAEGNPLSTLAGALSGGIAGLGALAGIVSGLFGESADDREDRRIREQNTEAIRELTKTFIDQVSGQTVATARGAVNSLLDLGRRGVAGSSGHGAGWVLDRDAVNAALEPFGLNLRDFAEQLKEINPNLELNTSSAADFIESLRQIDRALAEVDFRAFTETFGGQLSLLQLQFDLLDLTNPLDQLERLRELAAGEFGSPALTKALEGLDLTDPAQRAEAERRLLELANRAGLSPEQGGFTAADLGGMSTQELLEFIRNFEGLIDAFNAEQGTTTGGAPRQETFGVERRITEVQADRLISLGVSQDAHLVEIRDLIGGGSFVPVAPPPVPGGLGPTPTAGITLTINVSVQGAVDPGAAKLIGETLGLSAADAMAKALGSKVQQAKQRRGDITVTQ